MGRMSDATSTATPTGVVLDQPLAHALLLQAFDEGLLPGDDLVGDGFPRSLRSRRLAPTLTEMAFEQFILGGKVYVPFRVPSEWQEHLSAIGIVPVTPDADHEIEVGELDPDVLFGMLAQRGQTMTAERWGELLAKADAAIEEWERVAPVDSSFNGGWVSRVVAQVFKQPPPSTEEQAAWNAMQDAYEPIKLAVRCIDDFASVLATSLKLGALSSVPLRPAGRDADAPVAVPQASDTAQQTKLLRVTCRQLQRLPAPSTLQQTLHVAASPEAAALRERLASWSGRIHGGDVDEAAMIADEVAGARRHLV